MTPVVVGVDPGFATFGVSVVQLLPDRERVLDTAVLRTEKAHRKLTVRASEDNARRARELAFALSARLDRYRPVAVCAETMSWPRNASSAAKVALGWGVLCALLDSRRIPLVQASPQDVKKAVTGRKDASKDEVVLAVEARYPEVEWPSQSTLQEHAADAVAVVVACLDSEVIRLLRRSAA